MRSCALMVSLLLVMVSIVGVDTDVLCLMPLCHANIFHCLANVWAFLGAVFLLGCGCWSVGVSYAVAVGVLLLPWPWHTIGLSGLIYCLYGIVGMRLRRGRVRVRYHCIIGITLVVGIVVPQMGGWYHSLCYAVGLMVGFMWYRVWRRR